MGEGDDNASLSSKGDRDDRDNGYAENGTDMFLTQEPVQDFIRSPNTTAPLLKGWRVQWAHGSFSRACLSGSRIKVWENCWDVVIQMAEAIKGIAEVDVGDGTWDSILQKFGGALDSCKNAFNGVATRKNALTK